MVWIAGSIPLLDARRLVTLLVDRKSQPLNLRYVKEKTRVTQPSKNAEAFTPVRIYQPASSTDRNCAMPRYVFTTYRDVTINQNL